MRLISLFLISMIFPIQAYSQNLPHKFKDGDVIYADQINDNFEYLEKRFSGLRKTNVDCGTDGNGSGIKKAILEGFTSITISGICKEDLLFGIWNNNFDRTNNQQFPRLVRLIGSDSNSTIKDNSSNNDSLILVDSGSTLILDNLTLEGGLNGVYGTRNSNVLFDNVNINNFTNRGISIHDSSYLGVDEGGVNIQGNNAERGIIYLRF